MDNNFEGKVVPIRKNQPITPPVSNENIIIDFNIDGSSQEYLFELVDFLNLNKKELVEKFSIDVNRFLQNEYAFEGIFKVAYNDAFDEFVCSLVRNELINHFTNLNPEQIMSITEKSVLDMLTDGFYFNTNYYRKPTEGE